MCSMLHSDPYVKIIVMDAGGHKKFQSKTSIRGGEINPVFQETYLYDLPQAQLKEVTVIVSVYNNKVRPSMTNHSSFLSRFIPARFSSQK